MQVHGSSGLYGRSHSSQDHQETRLAQSDMGHILTAARQDVLYGELASVLSCSPSWKGYFCNYCKVELAFVLKLLHRWPFQSTVFGFHVSSFLPVLVRNGRRWIGPVRASDRFEESGRQVAQSSFFYIVNSKWDRKRFKFQQRWSSEYLKHRNRKKFKISFHSNRVL